MDAPKYIGRIHRAYQRRAAKWLARRRVRIPRQTAIISFTFDDFPLTALTIGGTILQQSRLRATYYASFGLMAKQTPTGLIFDQKDLAPLLAAGHELGCHTFDHCPAWETTPAQFEASCIRNVEALATLAPACRFTTLSYPISYPRPDSKRRLQRLYRACRGGGQTFNHGLTDLNYFKSFFIEQSRQDWPAIKGTIDAAVQSAGWLVFSTHDVCEQPTRFGCEPELFEAIVRYTVASGARILPVSEALDLIGAPAAPA